LRERRRRRREGELFSTGLEGEGHDILLLTNMLLLPLPSLYINPYNRRN
jgi:hypothetical protein